MMFGFSSIISGIMVGLGLWLSVLGFRNKKVLSIRKYKVIFKPNSQNLKKVLFGLALGLAVFIFTGIFVAGLLLGVGVAVFKGRLGSKKVTSKATEKSEAIANWTEMLHSIFISGGGIEKAIISSAEIAPEVIAPEVQRLASRLESYPIQEALYIFGQEMEHPAVDKIVAALTLSAVKGAHDIVGLLRSQAESIRADSRVMLELETARARHRSSALIIISVTLVMAAGLYIFEAGYLDPYKGFPGYLILLFVGMGFMLGFWLLIRMGGSETPQRHFKLKKGMAV